MKSLETTIDINGFTMVFGLKTIGTNDFSMVFPLERMVFQWFPMVANHWSDNGMVTIHRSGLACYEEAARNES